MSEDFRRNQYIKVIDPLHILFNLKKVYFVYQWGVDRNDNIVYYVLKIHEQLITLKPNQVKAYKSSNRQAILIHNPDRIPQYEKQTKFDLSKQLIKVHLNKGGK